MKMNPLELKTLDKYVDIGYFKTSKVRNAQIRSLRSRIHAWELGKEYYDGARINGYGGFVDDGRWKELLNTLLEKCHQTEILKNKDFSLLDLGCKKGFIVDAASRLNISAIGVESHKYPLEQASSKIKHKLIKSSYTELPFEDKSFDFA